jgi:hypothetical protein
VLRGQTWKVSACGGSGRAKGACLSALGRVRESPPRVAHPELSLRHLEVHSCHVRPDILWLDCQERRPGAGARVAPRRWRDVSSRERNASPRWSEARLRWRLSVRRGHDPKSREPHP